MGAIGVASEMGQYIQDVSEREANIFLFAAERSGLKRRKDSWWARRDLNPQPRDYESPALTVELQARTVLHFIHYNVVSQNSNNYRKL